MRLYPVNSANCLNTRSTNNTTTKEDVAQKPLKNMQMLPSVPKPYFKGDECTTNPKSTIMHIYRNISDLFEQGLEDARVFSWQIPDKIIPDRYIALKDGRVFFQTAKVNDWHLDSVELYSIERLASKNPELAGGKFPRIKGGEVPVTDGIHPDAKIEYSAESNPLPGYCFAAYYREDGQQHHGSYLESDLEASPKAIY